MNLSGRFLYYTIFLTLNLTEFYMFIALFLIRYSFSIHKILISTFFFSYVREPLAMDNKNSKQKKAPIIASSNKMYRTKVLLT